MSTRSLHFKSRSRHCSPNCHIISRICNVLRCPPSTLITERVWCVVCRPVTRQSADRISAEQNRESAEHWSLYARHCSPNVYFIILLWLSLFILILSPVGVVLLWPATDIRHICCVASNYRTALSSTGHWQFAILIPCKFSVTATSHITSPH